jgi:formylglycine-generating enzyme required for sulfatase activity
MGTRIALGVALLLVVFSSAGLVISLASPSISQAGGTATPDPTARHQTAVAATLNAMSTSEAQTAIAGATEATQAVTDIPTPLINEAVRTSLVSVPSGCFMMGSTEGDAAEQPVHEQCIEHDFWIGQYEVTNNEYRQCVAANACTPPSDQTYYNDPTYANHPVVFVSWLQANRYAQWIGGRLPTEAEWEYAARGVESQRFPWGNVFNPESKATITHLNFGDRNYEEGDQNYDDGYARTAPVGTYPDGNSWVGAADMSGNVWEWTSTGFNQVCYPYPYLVDGRNVFLPENEIERINRGGSWQDGEYRVRSTFRNKDMQGNSAANIGFRIVIDEAVATPQTGTIAEIIEPEDGITTRCAEVRVSGTYDPEQLAGDHLWLFAVPLPETADARYHAQLYNLCPGPGRRSTVFDENGPGTWRMTAYLGSTEQGQGQTFKIVLMRADDDTDAYLHEVYNQWCASSFQGFTVDEFNQLQMQELDAIIVARSN